jgi:hypothetical protein
MIKQVAWLVYASLVAGCSSEMWVSSMPKDSQMPKDGQINGIPFRPVALYDITVYQRQGDKWVPLSEVEPLRRALPDQDHIDLLRYEGMPLSNTTAKVTLGRDGTLKEIRLKDESQADEALTAAGAQIKAINEKLEAQRTAEATAETGKQDALLAYHEALADVERKQLEITKHPEGSPERGLAQVELTLAQIKANDKAARAGLAPPYPGASF